MRYYNNAGGKGRGCAVTAENDAIRVKTRAFVGQTRVGTTLIKKSYISN